MWDTPEELYTLPDMLASDAKQICWPALWALRGGHEDGDGLYGTRGDLAEMLADIACELTCQALIAAR